MCVITLLSFDDVIAVKKSFEIYMQENLAEWWANRENVNYFKDKDMKNFKFLTYSSAENITIGYLGFEIINSEIYLSPLYVTEGERNKGVGSSLINELINLYSCNKQAIFLQCDRALINFYEKFGFVVLGELCTNYFKMELKLPDTIKVVEKHRSWGW